jgi:hypothetical protein
MRLWFVETRVFTRRIEQLGLEAGLQALQEALLANPGAGALDAGTGGLRKLRMPDAGGRQGKAWRSPCPLPLAAIARSHLSAVCLRQA